MRRAQPPRTPAGRRRRGCSWRRFNGFLVIAMLAMWAVATLTGIIGNTAFIGHMSMLALVLAALASWRSDVPNDPDGRL